ncbi:MAG: TerC family protein [Planctomycetales bacterium]|nr:TerC family protein [Planctomycetales bacterium]
MEEFAKIAFALFTLTAMEIVLGIDNIVFIAIITARLPLEKQASTRRLGLAAALVMRVLLLLTLKWILALDDPFFEFSHYVPMRDGALAGLHGWLVSHEEVNGISWRDMILLVGGLFLIGKSVFEIHEKMQGHGHESHGGGKPVSVTSVLIQIAVLDIVFSLDSVITAVGMADKLWVMVVAVMIAVGVMMIFAESVSKFVEQNPTLKMLALSFLILIGVMLVAEGSGTHMNKGYIYFAMVFALVVEMLNMRLRNRAKLLREAVRT